MITEKNLYGENFYEIQNFLLNFLEGIYIIKAENLENKEDDTLEFAKKCDIETIHAFIGITDKEGINAAIKEGREILAMNPFPTEWVSDVINRFPFNLSYHNTKDEDYKEWLHWLLDNLEVKAKKAGKI